MSSLTHFSNLQNCIKSTNKIPEHTRDFKKEWLFIRGINKTCGEFVKRLDSEGEVFNSPQANSLKSFIKRFFRGQERGYLKDVSGFYLKYYEVNNIDCLEEQLDCYRDLYYDSDSLEFNQEYYELNVGSDHPGFKEFFELVSLFNDKVKKEELTLSEFMSITSSLSFDSYSDSDSD